MPSVVDAQESVGLCCAKCTVSMDGRPTSTGAIYVAVDVIQGTPQKSSQAQCKSGHTNLMSPVSDSVA